MSLNEMPSQEEAGALTLGGAVINDPHGLDPFGLNEPKKEAVAHSTSTLQAIDDLKKMGLWNDNVIIKDPSGVAKVEFKNRESKMSSGSDSSMYLGPEDLAPSTESDKGTSWNKRRE